VPRPPEASNGGADAERDVAETATAPMGAGSVAGVGNGRVTAVLIVSTGDDATATVGVGAAATGVADAGDGAEVGADVDCSDDEDGLRVPAPVASRVDDFFFGFTGFGVDLVFPVGDTTSPLTDVTGAFGESAEALGDADPPDEGSATDGEAVVGEPPPDDSAEDDDPGSGLPSSDGSARAGIAAITVPTPSAIANAPTRPTICDMPTNPPGAVPPDSPPTPKYCRVRQICK
jgi:hypothetical protein